MLPQSNKPHRSGAHGKSARKTGFTLIELLVVIAIIAILAAILFPVFAQARAKARQTVCISNGKQVGTALMMYVQDYDETYPVNNFSYGTTVTPFLTSWMLHLEPYTKNIQIYECPNRASRNTIATAYKGQTVRLPERGLGANEWIVGRVGYSQHAGGTALQPVSQAALNKPADTPIVADCLYILFNSPRRVAMANWGGNPWWAFPNSMAAGIDPANGRHNGGSTVVYADGHVKWVHQRNIEVDSTRSGQPNWWNTFKLPVDPQTDDRLR